VKTKTRNISLPCEPCFIDFVIFPKQRFISIYLLYRLLQRKDDAISFVKFIDKDKKILNHLVTEYKVYGGESPRKLGVMLKSRVIPERGVALCLSDTT